MNLTAQLCIDSMLGVSTSLSVSGIPMHATQAYSIIGLTNTYNSLCSVKLLIFMVYLT